MKELKNRELWVGGWVTVKDLKMAEGRAGGLAGKKCVKCRGEGSLVCPRCDGIGEVGGMFNDY